MKTILVVFADKYTSVEEANYRKMKKYPFSTKSEISVGDILKSKDYNGNMLVTDVIDKEYKFYNAKTEELSENITSTKYYPIKEIMLREENENVVYASKVNS